MAIAGVLGFGVAAEAKAAIVTFIGGDAGANSTDPHQVSNAIAANFDAAAGALGTVKVITFESSPVGAFSSLTVAPGVTLTGTDYSGDASGQAIKNAPFGSPNYLWGYNTTANGAKFVFISGGFITFSFATPISAFGAYLTGLQLDNETVTFSDGSSRTLTISNMGGGVQFEGFTDAGRSISSVKIKTSSMLSPLGDYIGVDDVRFVTNALISTPTSAPAVPETSTWVMMLVGFAALGCAAYLRGTKAIVSIV